MPSAKFFSLCGDVQKQASAVIELLHLAITLLALYADVCEFHGFYSCGKMVVLDILKY